MERLRQLIVNSVLEPSQLWKGEEAMRKFLIIPAVCVGMGLATSAQAGCLTGAAAGAAVGHVAGHHAVIGAAVGCAVGHHAAKEKQANKANENNQNNPNNQNK
jgi:hypothetical protein